MFKVAAAQMKFARTIEDNLAGIERLLAEASRRRADVVLFPECATTGYAYDFAELRPAEVRSALTAVGRLAARFRTNVLVGSPVFGRGKLYNGSYALRGMEQPGFLAARWEQMVDAVRKRAARSSLAFDLPEVC